MSNTVCGNYIGTAANGAEPLGNTQCGVRIDAGAQDNTIGGATASVRNVISGNGHGGVYISDADTTGNTVFGNYIGTNITGTVALGNAESGIYIGGGAQNNTVGGATAGTRNVISGNGQDGVRITGSSTMSNTVSGNYIGTDINGTAVLTNALDGVYIFFGAQNNTIGGVAAGEGNVISGNGQSGVRISNSGTTSNTISGNYIGTDVSGTAALGNSEFGVYITNGAQNNTVGSDNVIAHNGWDGVGVNGSSTTGNTITQNSIFSNDVGIDLTAGANGDIGAPVIVATTVGSVNVVGTACAGCTVEIFESGDTDGEGETYVGDTTADAGGTFTVTVGRLSNPYLTATATDAVDGTSEFSAVFISTVSSIFLPLVLNNY